MRALARGFDQESRARPFSAMLPLERESIFGSAADS